MAGDPLDRTGPTGRILAGLDRQAPRTLAQFVGVPTGTAMIGILRVFDVSIESGAIH
ncbi:hypothetical protein ACFW2K_37500 [Streptomyces nigra]|uniref:hypothetical protein n=1 Tax=Streptomyces nigra TaxID=1827580 RepID=UPI0036BB7D6A